MNSLNLMSVTLVSVPLKKFFFFFFRAIFTVLEVSMLVVQYLFVGKCVNLFCLLGVQCADHGFPSKPSAMAYDPKLKLLAIGTKSGVVKMYPCKHL